MGYQPRTNC